MSFGAVKLNQGTEAEVIKINLFVIKLLLLLFYQVR